MTFHAYLDGFSGKFDSLDGVRAWVFDLQAHYGSMRGKVLKIHKATWVASDGSGASYSCKPSHYRELVVQ